MLSGAVSSFDIAQLSDSERGDNTVEVVQRCLWQSVGQKTIMISFADVAHLI